MTEQNEEIVKLLREISAKLDTANKHLEKIENYTFGHQIPLFSDFVQKFSHL